MCHGFDSTVLVQTRFVFVSKRGIAKLWRRQRPALPNVLKTWSASRSARSLQPAALYVAMTGYKLFGGATGAGALSRAMTTTSSGPTRKTQCMNGRVVPPAKAPMMKRSSMYCCVAAHRKGKGK